MPTRLIVCRWTERKALEKYEERAAKLNASDAEVWDPVHDDYDKPHLTGQLFHYAPSPNRYGGGPFYELHVWAEKHNPRGAFADWNPNVSCAGWDGLLF